MILEFDGPYPKLYELTGMLHYCNNVPWGPAYKDFKVPGEFRNKATLEAIEAEAVRLDALGEDAMMTYIDGEYDDQIDMNEKYDLHKLNSWLAIVFDNLS